MLLPLILHAYLHTCFNYRITGLCGRLIHKNKFTLAFGYNILLHDHHNRFSALLRIVTAARPNSVLELKKTTAALSNLGKIVTAVVTSKERY